MHFMLTDISNNWLLFALLTPALWALCGIIDVCMVGSGAYERALDATVVSGAFGAVPLVMAVPMIQLTSLSFAGCFIAITAGALFFIHTLFFFKTLFALNDAASTETFNTLCVVLVPVLAFFLLGERLESIEYIALILAIIGTCVLAFGYVRHLNKDALKFSLLSVVFLSLSMVAQAKALKLLGYWPALAVFSATTLVGALFITFRSTAYRDDIFKLCKRFGVMLIIAELLQQSALLSSQRAITVGPSVSLVAVAESTLPLFIIAFSAVAVVLARLYPSSAIRDELQTALRVQVAGLPVKLVALIFIISGTWLVVANYS